MSAADPRDPLLEIELGVRGDTAATLGRAGRKVAEAIAALAACEDRSPQDRRARPQLLRAAADAVWAYVVQREAIGLTDHEPARRIFGVTAEVWRLMGAMPPALR